MERRDGGQEGKGTREGHEGTGGGGREENDVGKSGEMDGGDQGDYTKDMEEGKQRKE